MVEERITNEPNVTVKIKGDKSWKEKFVTVVCMSQGVKLLSVATIASRGHLVITCFFFT